MRKPVVLVVIALVMAGAPATTGAPGDGHSVVPTIDPALAEQLNAADPPAHLVVFVHGSDIASARSAVTAAGLRVLAEWLSIDVVVGVGSPGQVQAVTRMPGVVFVEADKPVTYFLDTARTATRSDEAIENEWLVGGEEKLRPGPPDHAQGPPDHARGPKPQPTAEPMTFDGAGRSIAIVDTGVDGTHPMFTYDDGSSKVVRNLRITCPIVFVTPGNPDCTDPTVQSITMVDVPGNDSDTASLGGHGTHVAGIAAGLPQQTSDGPLSGVAPGAKIVAISGGAYQVIVGFNTGLDWIAQNHQRPCGEDVPREDCPPITVVNNSYGSPGEFSPNSATARIQRKLVEAGVAMVWANGNSGGNGSANSSSIYGQDPTPGILTVANYNDLDEGNRDAILAPSSSRGQRDRVQTFPDISAPGTSILSACRARLAMCDALSDDPDYHTMTGTSMAAPHVAGAVAVLQQALEAAGGDTSAANVEDVLEDSAREFAFAGPYVPDVWTDADDNEVIGNDDSLTSFDKGHGLLDLTAAISLALDQSDTPPTSTLDCTDGPPTLTDPWGDGQLNAAPSAPADPALDVVGASLASDPEERTLTLTVQVADLPPVAESKGEWYQTSFWIGDRGHTMTVSRRAGGLFANRQVNGDTTGEVTYDPDAETITYTASVNAFDRALDGVIRVDGLAIDSGSLTAVVILAYADEAASACPGTLDVGVAPAPEPSPDPEPGT